MKIAYFTPVNPQRSGISDWAEELIPHFPSDLTIDIFTSCKEPEKCEIYDRYHIYSVSEFHIVNDAQKYDKKIFQVGNNAEFHSEIIDMFLEIGGILEIHDISMHHFLAEKTLVAGKKEEYISQMEYCHGSTGKKRAEQFVEKGGTPPWQNESLKFTVIKKYVDHAEFVIVHSVFAREIILGMNKEVPVAVVPLHVPDISTDPEKDKAEIRKKLNIPEEIFVMGSFGLASNEKRITQIIEQLVYLKKFSSVDFIYYIVGENKIPYLNDLIKKHELQQNVSIIGRTSIEKFKEYMCACDLCLNLRYPTQGETSASLHRMLGYGKHIMVTDVGSFREYPDEFVYKVRYDIYESADILKYIMKSIKNLEKFRKESSEICSYAKNNFEINLIAEKYRDIFLEPEKYQKDYIDDLIEKVIDLSPYDESVMTKLLGL